MARSTERRAAWPAPAKINLFLHITGRRPDGYHELQTLFQLLDWGDEIRVQATADPVIRREAAAKGADAPDRLRIPSPRLCFACHPF